MADDRTSRASLGFVLNRAVFRTLSTTLLVAFAWLAGWYLQGHSEAAWSESNYFSNPYRIGFLAFLFAEMIVIILFASRQPQVVDDEPRGWFHWRLVMWETLLVLAVFSDCMRIFPIRVDSAARWAGLTLLAVGLLIYAWVGNSRRKTLKITPESQFPIQGIFRYLRFPESLAAIFNAFGTALVFNAWTGLFIALISVVVIAGFVRAQDDYLLRTLRSPWADYQSKVKRIIPFIW